MKTGFKMGEGIYVGLDLATAAGYSESVTCGNVYGAPNLPAQRFVLVVEFINDPSYDKKNRVYVIKRSSDVMIRYYLIEDFTN